MTCVSIAHTNSNDLCENCKNSIDALRKNFSHMLFIIIITLSITEIIDIFRYIYFRKKYNIHLYD